MDLPCRLKLSVSIFTFIVAVQTRLGRFIKKTKLFLALKCVLPNGFEQSLSKILDLVSLYSSSGINGPFDLERYSLFFYLIIVL